MALKHRFHIAACIWQSCVIIAWCASPFHSHDCITQIHGTRQLLAGLSMLDVWHQAGAALLSPRCYSAPPRRIERVPGRLATPLADYRSSATSNASWIVRCDLCCDYVNASRYKLPVVPGDSFSGCRCSRPRRDPMTASVLIGSPTSEISRDTRACGSAPGRWPLAARSPRTASPI
ncbi:hypothetical protein DAEQUDRAFT_406547 [Daedalea quercina L-15889]|uniref:Secreted protein n=1 Tax=Daedalea quercina L-15889 TaxID=1314783 RepID=A0A165NNH6_9APHY|nr:hypothetical protein DAEQUDRAFT_406547 [Daedalea quercina L-15889]